MSTVLMPGFAISRQMRNAFATSLPASRMRATCSTDLSSGGVWISRRNTAGSVLRQTWVVPHHQVAVDLLHQVEADAHHDQEARPAVEGCDLVGDLQLSAHQTRND